MKKLFILLGITLLFTYFLNFPVFAQDATAAGQMIQQAPTYDMPYPGILPDNPLYPLKAFRDRLVSILISDPLKKAEFDLLNSDKRMSGGIAMINAGKTKLGIATLSKSNNYFEESVNFLISAHNMKENGKGLSQKMLQAIDWREYIIKNLYSHLNSSEKSQLHTEEQRMVRFEKRLKSVQF